MTIARHYFYLIQAAALLLTQGSFADTGIVKPDQLNAAEISTDNSTDLPAFTQNADCIDFINETPQRVSCGFIDLPLNHDQPNEGTITLPILIAGQTRTLSATPSQKAILVPGGGGPGASIGFGLAYGENEYLEIYDSLRAAGFDLVIMDQRGTGLARPALRCHETAPAFLQSVAEKHSFTESLKTYRASLKDCHRRLTSQRISLQHFDTHQSAKDYLSVTSQLPYTWWGVHATSYATVIAQEMAILEPTVFNRIVLDSPVAIDYQRPFTFELSEASIQRILSLCEITRQCNRKYKNISARYQEVRSRLVQQSISLDFEVYDYNNGVQRTSLHVDDATLLDMLILAAYSNYSIAEIPWLIDGLHKKNYKRLKPLAAEYWHYNTDIDFASALSWVIHCKERQPMEHKYLQQNPGEYDNYSEDSKTAFDQEKLTCSDWQPEPIRNEPHSGHPDIKTETLILAGDLDPVINRDDIQHTADNFANKQIMILPGTGHSVWFQSACTRQNVVTFFSEDSTANLITCKDGITRFK